MFSRSLFALIFFRAALGSGLVGLGLAVAFAVSDPDSQASAGQFVQMAGAFAVAVGPLILLTAGLGGWRARRRGNGAAQVVDGWIAAGLVGWLFFVRLEPAHQLVGPTRHLGWLGALDLALIGATVFVVVKVWESPRSASRWRPVLATLGGSLFLLAVARVQDPPLDRSADAAGFSAPPSTSAPSDPSGSRRVLFLGVDGLDWAVLRTVADLEALPTVRRLVSVGRRWSVDTGGLRRSPEIWATVHTGVPPERHGIWGFVNWSLWGGRAEVTARPYFGPHVPLFVDHLLARLPSSIARTHLSTGDGLSAPSFWEVAAAEGRPVVVTSPFPFTSPLLAIEGAMVVRDAEAGRWVVSRTRNGTTTESLVSLATEDQAASPEDVDSDIRSLHEDRVHLAEVLFAERQPQVGVFYTSWIDDTLHRHWRTSESLWGEAAVSLPGTGDAAIRAAFRQLDRDLGRLIDAFGRDATVVLMSDHGWELGEREHVFGPDGVLIWAPAAAPGFGGRVPLDVVAPSILAALGLPAEAQMPARTVDGRTVPRREPRRLATIRLRQAAPATAERLQLLKSIGYITR